MSNLILSYSTSYLQSRELLNQFTEFFFIYYILFLPNDEYVFFLCLVGSMHFLYETHIPLLMLYIFYVYYSYVLHIS